MKYRNKYKTEWVELLPLILCLVIIPILVKTYTFANPLLEYPWYSSDEYRTDFFLYYKAAATICCGVFMIFLVLLRYKKKKITMRDMLPLLPLAIYEILATMSSMFSEYSWFTIHGMPDQFESIFVLLAYGVICLYGFGYIYGSDNKQMNHVINIFLCGVVIVGIICTLQFLHVDIYRMIYSGDGYSFIFQPGQVYGAFYNINYVGSYVALVLPLCIMITLSNARLGCRVLSGISAILLGIALIGGDSTTGIVAVAAAAVCGLLFLCYKKIHNTKKNLLITAACFLVFFIFLGKPIYTKAVSVLQASNTEKKELESIITNDSNVEFHYNGHTLYLTMNIANDELILMAEDEDHQAVAYEIEADGETGYYRIDDERYGDCTVEPIIISEEAEQYGIVVHIGDSDWCISNQIDDSGTYYYVTSSRKATKLTGEENSGDVAFLENISGFASGRGYLWNKTLAVSKKYILLGSGADTFAMVYPNADFVDKSNNGYGNLIVTRPHCLYLQTAVQTGWLSLICMLVLFGWYILRSLRIYYRASFDNLQTWVGFGIMLGIIGYLVAGLANDSTVTVAPVFWLLLGIGSAINHNVSVSEERHN